MLSIIIPSYKDSFLQKTINSLLENAEEEIEIIAVLDGYWPNPQIEDHPKLRILHLGKNRGMRGAINAGVAISRGGHIMKCDAHCMFGKGFDRLLLERFKDNWVVTPRLYRLDTEKWELMPGRANDYNKIIFSEKYNKLTGLD
ncbi:MAG: glycosyltransferase [Candidatus Wolfebacteria bacterium]|nr:glycosyltransferase [Candidatus Wolfebacteria bacterium]